MFRASVVALTLTGLLRVSLTGQQTQISIGQTITGTLSASDSLYPDSTYYQVYQFLARPRVPITIDLTSDDFDPVLIIRGADLDRAIMNTHGGPGCGARVSRAFQSAGPYRILVNSSSSPRRQTGKFSLSIAQGSKPVQRGSAADDDCRRPAAAEVANDVHVIEVGQSLQGRLTSHDVLLEHDSTYAQPWLIHGVKGQTVTIDLESEAFDAYLFLRGPGIVGGRDFEDDDSGGHCNARLTATFPQTADYEIDVNTETGVHFATGAFTLTVTSGSKAKSVARCTHSGL